EWFRAWPNGATMAVQILILNEWESVPRHRKRPMAVDLQNRHDHQNKFDFLALGVREYGARHGIWRLLDVLDKHQVKATIPTNGLTAELFAATVRASRDRKRHRQQSPRLSIAWSAADALHTRSADGERFSVDERLCRF